MKSLKRQFFLYFVLLATALLLLLQSSYQQIKAEEKRLWSSIAENVFNQMQSQISDKLLLEDKRSFSEYRYYYVPENLAQGFSINISPLATLPKTEESGLVGYFQIDPDGRFNTPYLPPKKDQKKMPDLKKRQNQVQKISIITQSLQSDFKPLLEGRTQKLKLSSKKNEIIELGTLSRPKAQKPTKGYSSKGSFDSFSGLMNFSKDRRDSGSGVYKKKAKSTSLSRSKIYPNPLKQTRGKEPLTNPGEGLEESEADTDDNLTLKTLSNAAQYQTFTEQKLANPSPVTLLKKDSIADNENSSLSILTDPFRARLVDWKNIIFYRRVWVDQKLYLQGFVVKLTDFFRWTTLSSYSNSALKNFSQIQLYWKDRQLSQIGPFQGDKILFKRALGYPLNQFEWQVRFKKLPATQSRLYLYLLTLVLSLLSTVGLYFIYRTAASQVKLSEKRQDFVSAVTHELKTPLTSIRMYSEMLNENWISDESKKKEYYQLITSEGDRLSKLIDNVLQLARLEKRNFNFNLIKQCPKADFENFSRECADLAKKRGFHFSSTIHSSSPITYDPDAVKQILFSLLENSMKFGQQSKNKTIEMTLDKQGHKVIWSMRDFGPGVAETELKRIFDQFYRVENEQTRQTKGTGIGLSMAHMLASGMNAQLKADNAADQGLVVSLIFIAS